MAALNIRSRTRVDQYLRVVDGYLSDQHGLEVAFTEYAVESGSSLVDHATVRPERLQLEGFVSNMYPSAGVNESAPGQERAGIAFRFIREHMYRREPVGVETPLRMYEDMLVVGFSTVQDENTGRGMVFTLSMVEVQFVDVEQSGGGAVDAAPGSEWNDRVTRADRGRLSVMDTTLPPDLIAA